MRINANKIENRITFEIKTGYFLKLLMSETMKLLGSTDRKIAKNKNVENVPNLEITEVILVDCTVVNSNYKKKSRVFYTSVSNKSFDEFFDISSKHFIFLKIFNSEFSYIEVWFTDWNPKPLEIEDKINITLVIIYRITCKMAHYSVQRRLNICKRVRIFVLKIWVKILTKFK